MGPVVFPAHTELACAGPATSSSRGTTVYGRSTAWFSLDSEAPKLQAYRRCGSLLEVLTPTGSVFARDTGDRSPFPHACARTSSACRRFAMTPRRNPITFLALTLSALAPLAVSPAHAAIHVYSCILNPRQETPPVAAGPPGGGPVRVCTGVHTESVQL